MAQGTTAATKLSQDILSNLQEIQKERNSIAKANTPQPSEGTDGPSFAEHLKAGIQEVDAQQKYSSELKTAVATGESQNIHEAMIASSKAGLSFKFMVQVRNKALQAYQEVMKMRV